MSNPTSQSVVVPVERLSANRERFNEALEGVPDVADRRNKGQQFNAYDIDDEGERKAVCIGPITSRPLSLVEAPADVADLIEAALRLASDSLLAAAPAPSSLAGGEAIQKRVERVVFEDFFGSPVAGSKERLAKALIREFGLAALSPEAYAREGVTRDQIMGVVRQYAAPAWCSVDRMADALVAIMSPPALTPRHEAPAALCDHGHTDPMALCSDCEAASHEAPAEPCFECGSTERIGTACKTCNPELHEAPAATITSAELIANTDYARGAVRVPGETEDRRIYGQPEAPAEGAGEALDASEQGRLAAVINMLEPVAENNETVRLYDKEVAVLLKALRARSSAPEDREWEAPVRGEIRVINGKRCRFIERELEGDKWEIIGPAHPAAPSADKLRIAVEALDEARENLIQCGDHFGAGQCADAVSLISTPDALKGDAKA